MWSLSNPTAHWVNPDGSKPTTLIGFDIRNNALFLTANVNNFNQHHTWPISEVVSDSV